MTTRGRGRQDDVMSSHLTVSALAEEHHKVGVKLKNKPNLRPPHPLLRIQSRSLLVRKRMKLWECIIQGVIKHVLTATGVTLTTRVCVMWSQHQPCVFFDKAEVTNIMIIRRRLMVEFIHSVQRNQRLTQPTIDSSVEIFPLFNVVCSSI